MSLLLTTLLLFSLLVLNSACRQDFAKPENRGLDKVSAQATTTPTPAPDMSVSDFIANLLEIESNKADAIRRAWSRIPQHTQYRVVREDEFHDPIRPFEYGEIAGAYGLVLFIVNQTKSDDDRFSLIIFIERPGNRYDSYWIYRDMDLRGYSLSRASGSVFVEEILEPKRTVLCRIQWSKANRQWTCEPIERITSTTPG